ncbi:tRNA lysidine(34) synthetase TilS [Bacillus sp. REN10]|uniref:tRNA lysidine(34) synthetase TilS n=1 Tax=Bacillus sp. REN10 TaxID=2782541 RepID=UPI00193B12CF|nr:tRNA lysidine(34) synthetase TilS [Bacillus sp. REN10]
MLVFEEQMKRFIKQHQLIEKGDKIAVGVSGGPDSLALLHYLSSYRDVFGIEVYALHLDHMFRGEESFSELQFVEQFCYKHAIPCYTKQVNVATVMDIQSTGLQETARQIRYQFFQEGMRKFSTNKLALAHHGDDQIETVVMQLVKGASVRTGIPVRRRFAEREIIRPMLGLTKEMIEQYCLAKALDPRKDPSNDQLYYTRNRFRHHLLPFFKQENPKVHEHFQRFSEEMKEDDQFLNELTEAIMHKVFKKNGTSAKVQINAFVEMPLPLQRRAIHLILNYLYKGKIAFSFIHIQQILRLLKGGLSSGSLDLPNGLKVRREYDQCVFSFEQESKQEYALALQAGEHVTWPFGGQFKLLADEAPTSVHSDYCFLVDPDSVKLPLYVRTRKQGDKISPKGMNGSKKLNRLFIDAKVPQIKRDQWPIITDRDGEVLWVPRLKKSKYEAEVTSPHVTLIYTSNHLLGG